MEISTLPPDLVDESFRFALLLTGSAAAAEAALLEAVATGVDELEQCRSEQHRNGLLLMKVRAASLQHAAGPEPAAPPAGTTGTPLDPLTLAAKFRTIPEPERTALALFYLDVLEANEIADALHIQLEDLADLIERGRAHLQAALGPHSSPPSIP